MQPLVTPPEILSVYSFDFPFFFGGSLGLFSISLALLIILTVIIPIVVRSRETSGLICATLLKYGIGLAVVLSLFGGYYYQDFQRAAFADALAQTIAERSIPEIGHADSHGNVIVSMGGVAYRVPGSVLHDLRDRLFQPRHIKFDVPELIKSP